MMLVRNKNVRILTMLCFMLMLGFVTERAKAAGGEPNITYTINDTAVEQGSEISVEPGDEIKVVISVCDMTVATWAGGLNFDKDKLEVVSITGPDEERPGTFYVPYSNGSEHSFTAFSLVSDANKSGAVGFCWISTKESAHLKSVVANISLKVKEKTDSKTELSLYETSDGKDGYAEDPIAKSVVKVSIKKNQESNVTITPIVTPTQVTQTVTPEPTITKAADSPTVSISGEDIVIVPSEAASTVNPDDNPNITENNSPTAVEDNNETPIPSGSEENVTTISPAKTESDNKEQPSDPTSEIKKDSSDNSKEKQNSSVKKDNKENSGKSRAVIYIIISAVVAILCWGGSYYISRTKNKADEELPEADEKTDENDTNS